MADLNSFCVVGRLVKDPEIADAGSHKVVNISVAVQKNKSGPAPAKAVFMEVRFWDKAAETLEKYASKGSSVWVKGFIDMETWTSKEGKPRSKIIFVCERFGLIGNRVNRTQLSESEVDYRPQELSDFGEEGLPF